MKRNLFVIALALPFGAAVAIAQNELAAVESRTSYPTHMLLMPKTDCPPAVMDAFNKLFPDAKKIKCDKEKNGEYELNFELKGIDMSANFTNDGQWRETETTIPVDQFPAAVIKAIRVKYPQSKIVGGAKIESPGGVLIYEADMDLNGKKSEILLDASGAFVK